MRSPSNLSALAALLFEFVGMHPDAFGQLPPLAEG
jgi:hypothetical protein